MVLKHLPNILTLLRIACAPAILWIYYSGNVEAAIILTLVAAATDYLDGWSARALNRVTTSGAILDPVADKILILTLFTMLHAHGVIPSWLFLLSTVRNVSQLFAIPVLLLWKKIPFHVKPKRIPKWASALSYVVIVLGLAAMSQHLGALHRPLRLGLPGLSAVLAVLELHILVTFWPRFIAIYLRRHDTFE